MAEEKHTDLEDFINPNTDDMHVLNYLLRSVRGLRSVSGGSAADLDLDDAA